MFKKEKELLISLIFSGWRGSLICFFFFCLWSLLFPSFHWLLVWFVLFLIPLHDSLACLIEIFLVFWGAQSLCVFVFHSFLPVFDFWFYTLDIRKEAWYNFCLFKFIGTCLMTYHMTCTGEHSMWTWIYILLILDGIFCNY